MELRVEKVDELLLVPEFLQLRSLARTGISTYDGYPRHGWSASAELIVSDEVDGQGSFSCDSCWYAWLN